MNSRCAWPAATILIALCGAHMAEGQPRPARFIPAIAALDSDGDDVLSNEEIDNAPAALITLDANGSKTLTIDELMPLPGGRAGGRRPPFPGGPGGGGPRGGQQPGRGGMSRIIQRIPVLAALDADGDGEVSAAEIRDSARSLRALDTDQSRSLEASELLPRFRGRGGFGRGRRPDPRPAPIMTAIDRDGNGEIGSEELAQASEALWSLDSDQDGSLTRGETMPPEPPPAGRGEGQPVRPDRWPRAHPIDTALDADNSGDLNSLEIDAAQTLLAKLDADGNGALTRDELAGRFGPRGGRPGGPGGRGGPGGFRGEASAVRKLPEDLEPHEGGAWIPDRETFEKFSYQGSQTLIDTALIGLEFVKFVVTEADGDTPLLYFMNTENHRAHPMFMREMGIGFGMGGQNPGTMRGVIVYRPLLTSPSGSRGLYTYEFEPRDSFPFGMVQVAHNLLAKHSPLLDGHLAYLPLPAAVPRYREEQAQYEAAKLPVFLQDEVYENIAYLPLNVSEGYGLLRLMPLEERPRERDVVLYESLPNEMPRVAGIITGFRQTPLSHVNLRAVQDGVPNAFIRDAASDERISSLIGKYVYYRVAEDGYEIREATAAEVDRHFESMRPSEASAPPRDIEAKSIRPLAELGFEDHSSVGVKAANVAALGKLGFKAGVVPEGYAIPFHFYDAFMRHNGLYDEAGKMIEEPGFLTDTQQRVEALKRFRRKVKDGDTPEWMLDELKSLHGRFAPTQPIRLRSSTNNEDLPGFSGAGLYDSFTHHPDEGHIAKSVKQVYASLWNFRAFEEREFFRVDHLAAAMGVLVHPNYSGELANGVAVSEDIAYQSGGYGRPRMYYVNAQVGEDLVTNPEQESTPEEILLSTRGQRFDRVIRRSNRTGNDSPLLGEEHRDELRESLRLIHNKFKAAYGVGVSDPFAMEIEFKVTSEGRLAIKQARPWVFH